MAIEEVFNSSPETAIEIAKFVGSIALWLKAIGLFAAVILILYIVNWFINRRKLKAVYSIKEDLQRIEKKIDGLSKK